MNHNERQLRQALINAVPPLRQPSDRVEAVGARVRRYRQRMAVATGAAVIGVALAAGLPARLAVPRHPTAAGPVVTSPSPADDGVVRTAGCTGRTSPPANSIAGTPQPANQEFLSVLAGRIRTYAEAHFADLFTDVGMRQETNRIRVYRKPSAAFDNWIRHDFATECVEMVDAPYSAPELQAFLGQVEADRAYWKAHGIQFNRVSVDDSGTVTIGVEQARLEQARREIPSHYNFPVVIDEADPVIG
ncbi:hypothetical protein HC028_24555 [Planosporangium flavigriseum]|uniref:Uncharacterized protein n=1 Tax=Planosporangium flavigriseum TaxID=373681 RepID=A0A8J3PMP8_9ACTN|nr:hypothetical protein [Planosporangium flavigriseum]NJC67650.1 hypothetical protein [Planosporangium flavigriseum]GIG75781.1 hypothetical protein Pfl04_41850 [Planosporangium flavigriseum]